MKEKLRILILEDNAADANLMERVLKKARISFSARCVEGKEDLVKELEEFPPDLILADYKLPGFTALDALKIIEKRVPVTPVIVVTGAVGEEEAAKCIKSGAWDYLLKQNLEHLPAAVDRAIEEKRIIEEKKEAEKTLKNVVKLWDSTFNAISDGICLLTVDRKILKCNNSMAEFLGMPLDEMTGKICCELLHGTIEPVEECPVTRMKATRKRETEVLQFRDRWISVVCDPVTDEAGALAGAVHITRDITEIKKAEEVSKKEYKILEGIFEATLAGYWDWRVQENEEYFSPTFKKMFGYEAHELPNKPETWQKLIFPEDLPKVKENFDQHIKSHGEMPYYNEARYRHKDGSTVWVICAGRVIEWGPGGEALRMVGCHVDITERKKAEEAVLKEKQFSDFLIENLPDIFYVFDEKGKFLKWNKKLEEVTGYSAEEIARQSLLDHLRKEDRDRVEEKIKEVFEKGKADVEVVFVSKTGKETPYYCKGFRFKRGGKPYLIGMGVDISEIKKIEEVMKESEKKLNTLIQAVPDVIYSAKADKTGTVLFISDRWKEWTGRSPEECYSDPEAWPESLHPEDREKTVRNYIEAWEAGKEYLFEYRLVNKDTGQVRWALDHGIPLKDEKGNIVKYDGAVTDISERKRAEEILRANEKFLENVFDGIQDGISILDKNLNIVKTNKWIEKMYSSKTPLVGKKCYEIYQKRKETCPWCPSVKAMKTGEMQTEVVPYPSKEKPSGWMLLSAYPLEDESGIVTGVIEYVKNITDRVKAEEDIKKTLKELQEYKELTVGRENQMIELKKKVNELSKELGRAEPFDIAFAE